MDTNFVLVVGVVALVALAKATFDLWRRYIGPALRQKYGLSALATGEAAESQAGDAVLVQVTVTHPDGSMTERTLTLNPDSESSVGDFVDQWNEAKRTATAVKTGPAEGSVGGALRVPD